MDIPDYRLPPLFPQYPMAVVGILLDIPAEPPRHLAHGSDGHHFILTTADYQDRAMKALGIDCDAAVEKLAHQVAGLRDHAPKNIRVLAFGDGGEPEAAEIPFLKEEGPAEKSERRILETQKAKRSWNGRLDLLWKEAGEKNQGGELLLLRGLLRY